jgi:23S rRNA pseudoU1915 N3-methylase RlmH
MGNSTARPQTLWGSVIGEFFNFDRGVGGDDESIDITLDTDQVNAIYHIVSGRHLQVFTSGGEFYIPESPIKPSEVRISRQTRFGILEKVRPINVDGATMYIQRNGKQVREYLFTYTEASYVSSEVNLLAPHVINSPVAMASQTGDVENEGNYLFVVNGDGTMGVFITNRAEKVMAWTKYTTSGDIMDVAVVEDVVYLYVKRTINSSTVYHVEALDNSYYTDASIQVTQSSSTAVSGLSHLNGQACRVRADSAIMADATPSSGSITLSRAATNIEVGLNYDVTIKTMPTALTLQSGPISTKKRRISRVSAQLHESSGLKINGKAVPNKSFGANVLGQAPESFTGIKSLPILGYSKTAQVTVTQTDPLPLTLLGLTVELQVTG